MRRDVLAALVAFVVAATLTGQENPRWRGRWGARVGQPGTAVPRVTITDPTTAPSLTVSSSSLVLRGTAESTSAAPITSVTWSNDRGGSGSTAGLTSWETSGSASTTVVQDTFTGVSDTNLVPLVASPVGGAWVEAVNTLGSSHYLRRRAGGYVSPNDSWVTGGTPQLIDTVTPVPAISGTSYDVAVTLSAAAGGATQGAAIIFGYSSSTNYCAVLTYGTNAGTDLYLLKRDSGTLTTLGSAAADTATGDTLSVEVRGTNLTVKQNGVSQITASDAFCDNAMGVGLGVGAFRDVATDQITPNWRFDDFTVVDQGASAGTITLQSGVNVITVTAEDGASNVGTDILTVTFEASDTVDPEVTITSPTTAPTLATSTGTVSLAGTATDNTGVTAVTWACPTCTPTSGTATGTTSWNISTMTLASGANTITVTAADAAANEGSDVLTVTFTATDSTNPTIAITTNGGTSPFTVSSGNQSIQGTASDNVAVTSVSCQCATCTVGTMTAPVGASITWSAPLSLAPGDNLVTCTAADEAGNVSTADTLTFDYDPGTLTITTSSLPGGREAEAYSQQLVATGGTPPYTWSKVAVGTSLNDSDAHCAGLTISSAGVVSGTPTTAGTCAWTARVTDDVAATDDQALSIVVAAAGAEGPHDYFTDLIARGDCFKAYSLRPDPAATTAVTTTVGVADCAHSRYASQLLGPSSGGYKRSNTNLNQLQYIFATDPYADKQDAAKVTIRAWQDQFYTLGQDMTDAQTTITLAQSRGWGTANIGLKVDDEIMQVAFVQPSGTTATILRGRFGTTATTHTAGTPVLFFLNSIDARDLLEPRINTDGSETATYLFTWDAYWTDTWGPASVPGDITRLTNLKTWQISDGSNGRNFLQINMNFLAQAGGFAGDIDNPAFNDVTDAGMASASSYSQISPPGLDGYPLLPLEGNAPIVRANQWTRYWVLVEQNAEDDATKFSDVSTLAAAVTTTDQTTISVVNPFTNEVEATNPFSAAAGIEGATWPGRALRIGSEIMTIVSASTTGGVRNVVVRRGQAGTTAATHANGATVQLINDSVTMWVATETDDPVQVYDRMPVHLPINKTDPTARGAMTRFWLEFNTSTAGVVQGRATGVDGLLGTADDWTDLITYMRNLAVLKNPPSDWSALRVKPVR